MLSQPTAAPFTDVVLRSLLVATLPYEVLLLMLPELVLRGGVAYHRGLSPVAQSFPRPRARASPRHFGLSDHCHAVRATRQSEWTGLRGASDSRTNYSDRRRRNTAETTDAMGDDEHPVARLGRSCRAVFLVADPGRPFSGGSVADPVRPSPGGLLRTSSDILLRTLLYNDFFLFALNKGVIHK